MRSSNLPESDRARLTGLAGRHACTDCWASRPDTSTRFRHHRGNRLPHDVIVVDETSMVSLTMMARLLEAVRPDTRLILVGDPDQLSSVEAGAVLADLVDGLGGRAQIAELKTSHRFGESIGLLADAIRLGDDDRVMELLAAGDEHIEFVDTDRPGVAAAWTPGAAPAFGYARRPPPGRFRRRFPRSTSTACCARTGKGPRGVRHWNRQLERWLTEETGETDLVGVVCRAGRFW